MPIQVRPRKLGTPLTSREMNRAVTLLMKAFAAQLTGADREELEGMIANCACGTAATTPAPAGAEKEGSDETP